MKIFVLNNFGHKGENLAKGSIHDVDPADFGDTYASFEGEFFREATDEDLGVKTEESVAEEPVTPPTPPVSVSAYTVVTEPKPLIFPGRTTPVGQEVKVEPVTSPEPAKAPDENRSNPGPEQTPGA